MIREAARAAVPWTLHYGGRSRASMAFGEELARLGGERVCLVPQDEHGLLDLAGIVVAAPPDAEIYCCGPEPKLRAAQAA